MLKRLSTVATVTAFVSAVSVPAVAQRRPHGASNTASQPTGQTAATPDPTVEARQEYTQGTQALAANDAQQALTHFQRAYELRSNPVVLVPISECQQRLGQIPDAIATLERYLHDRADAPDRAQIEQRLATLRATPATVHVTSTPSSAHVLLDGHDGGQLTPTDLQAPPGHHALRLELTGHTPFTQDFDAAPGARSDVTATLEPSAPAASAVATDTTTPTEGTAGATTAATTDASASSAGGEEPAPRPVSPTVWVAGGVAVAGLAAGTVFGFLALGEKSDYDAMPTAETRDRGQTFAQIADIGFAVTIIAASIGVLVYFADRAPEQHHAEQHATLRRGPQFHVAPTGFALNF